MNPASMADQAYKQILRRMLHNELKPGDWLDRRKMANELNASLTPVAEAIQRLTNEGFLVAVPRRGTQVRVPDRDDVRGQIYVRQALECEAARLYCGEVLLGVQERMTQLAQQADRPGRDESLAWRTDLEFHRALVELTHCRPLIENFNRVMNLSLFQHTALMTPYPFNHGDAHCTLLKDLLVASPATASDRMRRHIRVGKEQLLPPAK